MPQSLDIRLVKKIEDSTGMTFLEEKPEGNLCYRDNLDDLQDAFKHSFGEQDFFNYRDSFKDEAFKIPDNREEFWNRIKQIRNHES